MSEEVKAIIQADRDNAADYGRATFSISTGEKNAILRGEWDDLPRVQFFAELRARSSQPAVAREEGGVDLDREFIRTGLEVIADDKSANPLCDYDRRILRRAAALLTREPLSSAGEAVIPSPDASTRSQRLGE